MRPSTVCVVDSVQPGRIARHIIERRSVAAAGADQKAVGAVGANEGLGSGQRGARRPSRRLRARLERIVAMRALLQRRHDQRRAGHRALQHRMRRVALRQRGRRDRRKPDRLADEPAPGLLEHQSEFGEAKTESDRGRRNQDAEPAEFSGLAQPLGREARIAFTKSARDFRPRRADEFRGAVAQQHLLRCQMQVHDRLSSASIRHLSSAG